MAPPSVELLASLVPPRRGTHSRYPHALTLFFSPCVSPVRHGPPLALPDDGAHKAATASKACDGSRGGVVTETAATSFPVRRSKQPLTPSLKPITPQVQQGDTAKPRPCHHAQPQSQPAGACHRHGAADEEVGAVRLHRGVCLLPSPPHHLRRPTTLRSVCRPQTDVAVNGGSSGALQSSSSPGEPQP